MQPFGKVLEVQRAGTQIRLRAEQATLELEFLSARLLRARLVFPDDVASGQKVALPLADPQVVLSVDDGDTYTLRTAAFSVHIRRDPLRLEFRDLAGNVLVQTNDTRTLAWESVDDGRRRVQAQFRRATEEHYYGLGQAGPGLDKDGTTRRLWNSHYGFGPGTDMAVPLVVSSRGYGLFFDNSWDAAVSFGRSDERSNVVYTAEGGQLDCYFMYGPSPKAILAEYARLTGHPPLPPRWAFGYIQSTRHFENADEIVDLAQTLRAKHVPCDAMVFLSTYGQDMGMNNGVGTLEFHPRLWAEPAALLRQLKDRHLRVVSHEYPVVSPKSPAFVEAEQRGYLVDYDGGEGSVMFNEGQRYLDFTNPAVGGWWWDVHQPLVELGVDGWWLDGGEGPPSSVSLHAGSGQALHNSFDFNRQQAFAEGERRSRPEQRSWLLCRSGYAGMQRLGSTTWSGDISNTFGVFANQLSLGLSTAMSGVPYWGTDIGGFFHTVPESPELFTRWFQFAAFCPIFRSHGRGIGTRGWREHLPWAHGAVVEDICRTFAEWRYRLFPYNYSLAWQAHVDGTPLMRPAVLEYPDDPNVVDMTAEYLWGPSLLVAPVTAGGATHWPVYLPRGTWYDFWTRARYDGEQWIEVPAPLERLPLLVRGGAIVPLGPVTQYLDDRADSTLSLLIYPDGESSFELYEDDGVSWAYESGAFAVTTIRCSASEAGVLRVTLDARRGHYGGMPPSRTVLAQVYLPGPLRQVAIAGMGEVPRVGSRAALQDAQPAWWHDGDEHFLWLAFTQADSAVEIAIAR
jgi:alpha-glucosidase (family GH31 glycosyl hydrolase)